MTKKILSVVLSAFMLVSLCAGCGDKKEDDSSSKTSTPASSQTASTGDSSVRDLGGEDNITLKVWGPSTQQELLASQIEEFKALYPDVTMNIEVGQCEESEAQTQVRNDIEAAADIFAFPSDHLEALVKSGSLAYVLNYSDVTAASLEGAVDAATYDDILYAYPLTADNSYITFYDNTVLTEDDVKSLDKMVEVAKAAGKKVYFNAGDGFYACTFSFTGGLKIEHDYVEGTEKHTYDEASVLASLKAFGELYKTGTLVSAGTDVAVSAFNSDAAAIIDGTWDAAAISGILGDKMGAAKLPTINIGGTDTQLVNLFGYKLMGVKSSTKFPNTAHALAEYLSGEKCQTAKAETLSIGPANKVAASSDAVLNNPVLKAVSEQMQYSIPQKSIANGFWNAHKALGTYLSDTKSDLSDAKLKEQLDLCLESTNDI